ncbi:MAG: hypothetical protein AAF718_13380 [Pseudomonadota bacterium]
MRHLAVLYCLSLIACTDWPDAGGAPSARSTQDWPNLLPLDEVLASSFVAPASEEESDTLLARAAALRNRASIMRGSASDMEALRARLSR